MDGSRCLKEYFMLFNKCLEVGRIDVTLIIVNLN